MTRASTAALVVCLLVALGAACHGASGNQPAEPLRGGPDALPSTPYAPPGHVADASRQPQRNVDARPLGSKPDHSAATTATQAAHRLIRRLLPNHADRFTCQSIPSADGRDVFEIETHNGQVVLRGNNAVSIATGLNWYLKHDCHCHVSWRGSQLDLPDRLPEVPSKIRKVSWAKHRYFLNYCCFGYSLAWWDWDQWRALIDWMALHGVNMPLSVTGQEAVWRAVCRRLDLNEQHLAAFLAGPPYLPFGWMGCLDGWGGPLPQEWIDRHERLQKKILRRQRALGMTPVLQGFTGHVPPGIAQKYPHAKLHEIHWIEWTTRLLDPLDPLFAEIAHCYMEEQLERFGTDHVYAADTFIEMTPPRGDLEYLDRLSRAIYDGMAQSDPQAVWVLQTWTFLNRQAFWTQPRIKAFLDAVPNERMVCLDLFCEERPQWRRTQAFYGKPWLWCNIQNFGNTVFLGGPLRDISDEPHAARHAADGGNLVGLGFVNEGLGYNPVVYDLMFEMAWHDRAVDLTQWIRDYSVSRYGKRNTDAAAAWSILQRYRLRGIASHAFDHRPDSVTQPSPRCTVRQRPARGSVAPTTAGCRDVWPGGHVPLRLGQHGAASPIEPRRSVAARGCRSASVGRSAGFSGSGGQVPRIDPRP